MDSTLKILPSRVRETSYASTNTELSKAAHEATHLNSQHKRSLLYNGAAPSHKLWAAGDFSRCMFSFNSTFPDTSCALKKCFVSFRGLRQNICWLPALIMKDISIANTAGIWRKKTTNKNKNNSWLIFFSRYYERGQPMSTDSLCSIQMLL